MLQQSYILIGDAPCFMLTVVWCRLFCMVVWCVSEFYQSYSTCSWISQLPSVPKEYHQLIALSWLSHRGWPKFSFQFRHRMWWNFCPIFAFGCIWFLPRDIIYTSRAYATMSVSVCLSVTEVDWHIIANLGSKFRSTFTAHCARGARREEGWDHRREE